MDPCTHVRYILNYPGRRFVRQRYVVHHHDFLFELFKKCVRIKNMTTYCCHRGIDTSSEAVLLKKMSMIFPIAIRHTHRDNDLFSFPRDYFQLRYILSHDGWGRCIYYGLSQPPQNVVRPISMGHKEKPCHLARFFF